MWKFALATACVLLVSMESEGAKRTAKRGVSSNSGAYSSAGTGIYGDYDDYGFGSYAPDFGFNFIDPYAFHQQLTQQILAQQAAQQEAIAQTFVNGDATVTAAASNLPDDANNDYIYRQQQALFNNIQNQNQYAYTGNKANRYAPNYSVASAGLGPNGGYQTAFISPENPSVPNFSTRFGSSSPGGYKGVSVSSYSSSNDINGKRTSNRGAQTTINDNGRVTTYKVHS